MFSFLNIGMMLRKLESHFIKDIKLQLFKKYKNPKNVADYLYYLSFGKKIDWNNPEDLNQWINWLEFNSDTSVWHILADKYAVRDYIEAKGFEKNLVPLISTWNHSSEIIFETLPDKFVLKLNNGCGDVRIINDKDNIDSDKIRRYFDDLQKRPFGIYTGEPHYSKIPSILMAEKLLDLNRQSIKSSSLIDYKFWCFNGMPFCCLVCRDRKEKDLTLDLYTADTEWKNIRESNLVYKGHIKKPESMVPMPKNIEEMLKIASSLSIGFPQLRVDLYEVEDKVYIGELTLTSACGRMGYFTEDFLKEMGNLCREAYFQINPTRQKTN